jgi:hypothetical protein
MKRWLALALLALGANNAAADTAVPVYTATYRVEYKGKEAGSSEFSVREVEPGVYEFTSRTMAKGLLKLARPNPAIDRSRFRIEQGAIRPLEFWYEDGSRSGEDNAHIVFDWPRQIAVVSTEAGRREMALPAAALDRGSVQVALMRDLSAARMLGPYEIADDDSVTRYDYTDGGPATTKTRAGSHETRLITQQRVGSSRTTLLWVAPALHYLPVRIEQRRNGEVNTAFELVRVEGLTP